MSGDALSDCTLEMLSMWRVLIWSWKSDGTLCFGILMFWVLHVVCDRPLFALHWFSILMCNLKKLAMLPMLE